MKINYALLLICLTCFSINNLYGQYWKLLNSLKHKRVFNIDSIQNAKSISIYENNISSYKEKKEPYKKGNLVKKTDFDKFGRVTKIKFYDSDVLYYKFTSYEFNYIEDSMEVFKYDKKQELIAKWKTHNDNIIYYFEPNDEDKNYFFEYKFGSLSKIFDKEKKEIYTVTFNKDSASIKQVFIEKSGNKITTNLFRENKILVKTEEINEKTGKTNTNYFNKPSENETTVKTPKSNKYSTIKTQAESNIILEHKLYKKNGKQLKSIEFVKDKNGNTIEQIHKIKNKTIKTISDKYDENNNLISSSFKVKKLQFGIGYDKLYKYNSDDLLIKSIINYHNTAKTQYQTHEYEFYQVN